MSIAIIISSTLFALWGLQVVRHDLDTCKIPNAQIIYGLKLIGIFLGVFLLFTISGYMGNSKGYLLWSFYGVYIIHFLLSCIFGIMLWYCEIWPAGDAKFYIVCSAALPIVLPTVHGYPYTLFFYLLINIFVLAAFWSLANFFFVGFNSGNIGKFFADIYGNIIQEYKHLQSKYNGNKLLLIFLGMLVMFLMQKTISLSVRHGITNIIGNTSILFFTIFVLWEKITALFKKKWWIIFSGVFYVLYFVIGYYLFKEQLYSMLYEAFWDTLKLSLTIVLLRKFAVFLMEQADMQTVYPEELKPGMILSPKSRDIVFWDPNFGKDADTYIKDGLTEIQIQLLRKTCKDQKIENFRLEIIKGRPFAIWIFIGSLLTILFKANIAALILK